MSERIEQFTAIARKFCEWAESEFPGNLNSARQALELITELYLFGILLTDEEKTVEATPPIKSGGHKGNTVYAQASNLPLKYYSEVFNPLPIPGEEPIVGDLADDIADIYKDIRRGLDLLDAGYTEHAVWEWTFHLQHHWGEHATSAIRALHWFLCEQKVFM